MLFLFCIPITAIATDTMTNNITNEISTTNSNTEHYEQIETTEQIESTEEIKNTYTDTTSTSADTNNQFTTSENITTNNNKEKESEQNNQLSESLTFKSFLKNNSILIILFIGCYIYLTIKKKERGEPILPDFLKFFKSKNQ